MIVLKYKKGNKIEIGTFVQVLFASVFENEMLNIFLKNENTERKIDNIDEYSVYQNGTLIEHQDKRDYIKDNK